jgi:hypothetical protein
VTFLDGSLLKFSHVQWNLDENIQHSYAYFRPTSMRMLSITHVHTWDIPKHVGCIIQTPLNICLFEKHLNTGVLT